MGWMDKLSRKGRWQRRWFVLGSEAAAAQQHAPPPPPLLYYYGSPGDKVPRAVANLRGAQVLGSLTSLAANVASVKRLSAGERAGGGGGVDGSAAGAELCRAGRPTQACAAESAAAACPCPHLLAG